MAAYEVSAHRLEAAVMQYHHSSDWTPMESVKSLNMWYRKSPHFDGTLYKFQYDMDAPENVVYNVMKPPLTTKERLDWDTSIKHFECLRNIADDMMIGLIRTHFAEEFVDLYYFKRFAEKDINEKDCDRESWIFAESLKYDECPETSDCVRVWNYPTGYAVSRYRNDPNKCKLTLYINANNGGVVPKDDLQAAYIEAIQRYIESIQRQVRRVMSDAKCEIC